jgi:hypothetical protein
VLPVSDALSIGRQVDAVILVVRAGQTTRDEVVETLDSLRQVGADVIGACLIGVKGSSAYGEYTYDPAPELAPPGPARRSQRSGRRGILDVREPPGTEVTLLLGPGQRPAPPTAPPS